ncbi:efflux RND transporter periplasmic adaptor subunit [Cohaesibacter celericrescens]|uniref:efflux RND transporter periplasmic adaptor subunit n=1 Tax=Cohaesibacter celericrescens TaxID=2067669 RepID=UPI00356AC0A6
MIKKLMLIGFSALLLAGCNSDIFSAVAEEAVVEDPSARPAKIATARKIAFNDNKIFPGVTEASRNSVLAFRVAGQITELKVHAGQTLKEGDVIAELDETPYLNVVAAKQATYDLANTQLVRTQALFDKKHVAKAALDTAKSTFSAAEVALKMAKEDLGYTKLYAPYDGVVAQTNVERYQNVAAGTQIVQYQGLENIDVVFNVPEKIFLMFNPQKFLSMPSFEVRFDALPGKRFTALYKEHDELPDTVTRSFKITATMPRPEQYTILPGMSISVVLDLSAIAEYSATKGVLVPLESVFDEGGKRWVWKVDSENLARKTEVGIYGIEDDGVRIQSGLDDGDKVIAVGVAHVTEGMKVRPYKKERGL